MPKKKQLEPPEKQSERFRRDAQRMIDAGELDPTAADEAFEKIIRPTRDRAKGP